MYYIRNSVDISVHFPEFFHCVFFKSDGSKMYVSRSSNGEIYAWDLSTNWDVSTAVYNSEMVDLSGYGNNLSGIFINSDGTRLYISDYSFDVVRQFTLNTPWLISSAAYVDSVSISGAGDIADDIFMKSDGSELYVCDYDTSKIYQYNLGANWDITTAVYNSKFVSVGSEDLRPRGIFINSSGTTMYITGEANDSVFKYTLSTAWDVSSAVYDNVSTVISEDSSPIGCFLKSDESKLYIVGSSNAYVYEYTSTHIDETMDILKLQNKTKMLPGIKVPLRL